MFKGILQKVLLEESATPENVTRAMDNHSYVIINYHSKGEDEHTGSRVIQPFAYGLTKNGDPVLRAFQPYGDTTTRTPGWKMFRLDRISYWEETKRKFYELPDEKYGHINKDGDDCMHTVIKDYSSTVQTDATNGINVGPKTKEKVYARTSGDKKVDLGNHNMKNQKDSIYVDLDNNRKAGANFRMATSLDQDNMNSTGPRTPDNMANPDINGSVKNGDISQEELNKAREQVYGNNGGITDDMWKEATKWSDYSHEYTPEEWDQYDWDDKVLNRDNTKNKDLSTSRRRWERENSWQNRADNGFLNRADSGNRQLYDMDDEDENL